MHLLFITNCQAIEKNVKKVKKKIDIEKSICYINSTFAKSGCEMIFEN